MLWLTKSLTYPLFSFPPPTSCPSFFQFLSTLFSPFPVQVYSSFLLFLFIWFIFIYLIYFYFMVYILFCWLEGSTGTPPSPRLVTRFADATQLDPESTKWKKNKSASSLQLSRQKSSPRETDETPARVTIGGRWYTSTSNYKYSIKSKTRRVTSALNDTTQARYTLRCRSIRVRTQFWWSEELTDYVKFSSDLAGHKRREMASKRTRTRMRDGQMEMGFFPVVAKVVYTRMDIWRKTLDASSFENTQGLVLGGLCRIRTPRVNNILKEYNYFLLLFFQ